LRKDGRFHPNKVLAAIDASAIVINDGNDFLAFDHIERQRRPLDPGPFGCIGVGVPYGIAASLPFPDRKVLVTTGRRSIWLRRHLLAANEVTSLDCSLYALAVSVFSLIQTPSDLFP
jgi:hypothetical protein